MARATSLTTYRRGPRRLTLFAIARAVIAAPARLEVPSAEVELAERVLATIGTERGQRR
jgi:hypothetical protein